MGLFKLNPARSQHLEGAKVIADLDALIAEPVAFRFNGRTHLIKPVTTLEFYRYIEASLKVTSAVRDPAATKDQVIDAAHGVVKTVCDSISRQDLESMTQSQIAALLNLVVESVSGRAHGEYEKKKKVTGPMTPKSESGQ